jgi:hypothetical protein
VQSMTWQQVGEEVFRPAQWMANVQAVWPFSCLRRGKQKELPHSPLGHKRLYRAYGDTAHTLVFA